MIEAELKSELESNPQVEPDHASVIDSMFMTDNKSQSESENSIDTAFNIQLEPGVDTEVILETETETENKSEPELNSESTPTPQPKPELSFEYSIIPEDAFDDNDTMALFDEESPLFDEEDQTQDNQREKTDLNRLFSTSLTSSQPPSPTLFRPSDSPSSPAIHSANSVSSDLSPENKPTIAEPAPPLLTPEVSDLSIQETLQLTPSRPLTVTPSARERALAEHEDSSQAPRPIGLSFTPAPIQTSKHELITHHHISDDQSNVNPATITAFSFTPLPLSSAERKSKKSLFPTPKNQIDFDRSKHDFHNFVEEELPSPLRLKNDPDHVEIDENNFGENTQLDVEELLDGLEFDDEILDGLETDVDLPALGSEPFNYMEHEANRSFMSSELESSFTPELSLLAEDADALNQDFEEAFVAIQTPLFGLNISDSSEVNHTSDEVNPIMIESSSATLQESIMELLDQAHALHWRVIQPLDLKDKLGLELLDLIELYIHSGQYELAHDQLAIALLNPNPALTVCYINAYLLMQLGQQVEACQSFKDIYISLEIIDKDKFSDSLAEVLIKWAISCQQIDKSSEDLTYILSEAHKISFQFGEALTNLVRMKLNH